MSNKTRHNDNFQENSKDNYKGYPKVHHKVTYNNSKDVPGFISLQGSQRKGQKLDVECLRLLSDGSGVSYANGFATFVPGLLPGELAEVEVIEAKKRYQRARLKAIIKPSPERRDAPCPVFEECGGCQLQHTTYAETLSWKQSWVKDALMRIGKLDVDVLPTIGMEKPWRYRNKVRLHREPSGEIGYFREKSKELIDFQDCLLISERMNRWIEIIRGFLTDGYPGIHTITFRENRRGEGLILLEGSSVNILSADKNVEFFAALQREGVRSVWGNSTAGKLKLIWGDRTFSQTILNLNFELSPLSFLQVNLLQTDVLYSLVLAEAALTGKEVVWDLYSGIGTLTLVLAQKARKVIGIEENPFAVKDAVRNAENNQADGRVKFIEGKVELRMSALEERPDVVVADPPRAGMHPEVVRRLLEVRPERIIYVSCDPGTLARDLGGLVRGGYMIERVQPVDMFAWAGHVETVCLLTRKTGGFRQ